MWLFCVKPQHSKGSDTMLKEEMEELMIQQHCLLSPVCDSSAFMQLFHD